MKVIVVANQKGGSGKSTILVHLAAAADYVGDGPVIFSDTDPQGTAADWFNQRKKSDVETPRYAPLAFADLDAKFAALKKAGASYFFIDTAPSLGEVNAELFDHADVILIPLNPTPADLRALVKALPLIRKSGKPFYFVLARVRPNLRSNDGTAVALARIIHRTARNRPRPPNTWARDFIAKNFIKQPIRIVVNNINGLALIAHFS